VAEILKLYFIKKKSLPISQHPLIPAAKQTWVFLGSV